jgi:menaquinol-cytochrome c reductase iron-sulfur subunit
MDPIEQHPQNEQSVDSESQSVRSATHSRRAFLFKLSLLLNGAVGAVLAVPIIGYLLGPAIKKGSSYNSWIRLVRLMIFPKARRGW